MPGQVAMSLSTFKHAVKTSNTLSKVQVRWETLKYCQTLKYTGRLSSTLGLSSTLPKAQVRCQNLKYAGACFRMTAYWRMAHVFETPSAGHT